MDSHIAAGLMNGVTSSKNRRNVKFRPMGAHQAPQLGKRQKYRSGGKPRMLGKKQKKRNGEEKKRNQPNAKLEEKVHDHNQ
jgi:hypothetical protein